MLFTEKLVTFCLLKFQKRKGINFISKATNNSQKRRRERRRGYGERERKFGKDTLFQLEINPLSLLTLHEM